MKKRKQKATTDVVPEVTSDEQRKYQAEDDLRTIMRAAEIESDKVRADAARKLAQEQAETMMKIAKKG